MILVYILDDLLCLHVCFDQVQRSIPCLDSLLLLGPGGHNRLAGLLIGDRCDFCDLVGRFGFVLSLPKVVLVHSRGHFVVVELEFGTIELIADRDVVLPAVRNDGFALDGRFRYISIPAAAAAAAAARTPPQNWRRESPT